MPFASSGVTIRLTTWFFKRNVNNCVFNVCNVLGDDRVFQQRCNHSANAIAGFRLFRHKLGKKHWFQVTLWFRFDGVALLAGENASCKLSARARNASVDLIKDDVSQSNVWVALSNDEYWLVNYFAQLQFSKRVEQECIKILIDKTFANIFIEGHMLNCGKVGWQRHLFQYQK